DRLGPLTGELSWRIGTTAIRHRATHTVGAVICGIWQTIKSVKEVRIGHTKPLFAPPLVSAPSIIHRRPPRAHGASRAPSAPRPPPGRARRRRSAGPGGLDRPRRRGEGQQGSPRATASGRAPWEGWGDGCTRDFKRLEG